MRLDQPSRSVIDPRTEKESRLKSFIAEALSATETVSVTLVARATDSPVARALAAAVTDSGRSDLQVNVVLFDIDGVVEDHADASILDLRMAQFRVLHDARFAAAHEQLVVGTNRAWIGDCMRRDPQKRDAFEFFHADSFADAAHAIASFSRIWGKAKPLARTVGRALAPEVIAAGREPRTAGQPTPRR